VLPSLPQTSGVRFAAPISSAIYVIVHLPLVRVASDFLLFSFHCVDTRNLLLSRCCGPRRSNTRLLASKGWIARLCEVCEQNRYCVTKALALAAVMECRSGNDSHSQPSKAEKVWIVRTIGDQPRCCYPFSDLSFR